MLVFVSYCLRDLPLVKPLVLELGVLGHNVLYEPKMPAGQILWSHVLESINACDVFLLGITDHTLQSESRTLELQYARRLGKPVFGVLLSELTKTLPPEFSQALDYISPTKQADDNLAKLLKTVPSRMQVSEDAVEPDWLIPLMKLHSLVRAPHIDPADQQMIILNLQEFLERQETFRATRAILKSFATRRDIDADVQADVKDTIKQLKQSQSTQQRARMRNIALAGSFVTAILIVVLFILYRREQAALRVLEATQTEQAVQVTQTGFVLNKDVTGTANSIASSIASTEAARQTETARPTTTPSPTPDARFIYESIFTGVIPTGEPITPTPTEPSATPTDAGASPTATPSRTLLPPVNVTPNARLTATGLP